MKNLVYAALLVLGLQSPLCGQQYFKDHFYFGQIADINNPNAVLAALDYSLPPQTDIISHHIKSITLQRTCDMYDSRMDEAYVEFNTAGMPILIKAFGTDKFEWTYNTAGQVSSAKYSLPDSMINQSYLYAYDKTGRLLKETFKATTNRDSAAYKGVAHFQYKTDAYDANIVTQYRTDTLVATVYQVPSKEIPRGGSYFYSATLNKRTESFKLFTTAPQNGLYSEAYYEDASHTPYYSANYLDKAFAMPHYIYGFKDFSPHPSTKLVYYTYTEDSLIALIRQETCPNSSQDWTYTETRFEYDKSRHLVSSKTNTFKPQQSERQTIRERLYTYNKNGLLLKFDEKRLLRIKDSKDYFADTCGYAWCMGFIRELHL